MSLDDEAAETGCTVIVPGMHTRLREWWGDVERRSTARQPARVSGRVHNVRPLWHSSDAAKMALGLQCHVGAATLESRSRS